MEKTALLQKIYDNSFIDEINKMSGMVSKTFKNGSLSDEVEKLSANGMTYKCPKCGYVGGSPGKCPKCDAMMVKK